MFRGTKFVPSVIFAVLNLLLMSLAVHAEEEAPTVSAFANAPGWITVVWDHSGEDVYSFVVERQGPPYDQNSIVAVAILNSPTRQFTDMNLQAETTYNHRVCAVYDYYRTCSEWITTTTFAPQQSPKPSAPSAPAAPPLSTPVLKATATGTKNIQLQWDYNYADHLTSMALYRDDQFIFDGAISGNFTSSHIDSVPEFNTEYTYKLCFSNPDEKDKCSEAVTISGTPIAPTVPADVRVAKIMISGGNALGGAVMMRPKNRISVSWRNTDVPGQFIIVEALDTTVPGDAILGGAAYSAPRSVWIEATRISGKSDPTSLDLDTPRSLISTNMTLTTYRLCAVVPSLGEAGKVCSEPVTVQ